ncbi:MAG: DNA cytosine methyltransferase [Candidatus Sulfotelmatobacter sp.]
MPICDLVAFEICSGAGGQAAGLEAAGFDLAAAVEIDSHACRTLRANRPHWHVIEADIREINGRDYRGIDLFAGGVPCPPFSIAGKQLGREDERDLFPEAVRLIEQARPTAVLLENVPGFAMERFRSYRRNLLEKLSRLGYWAEYSVLNACSFGVPQLRPRFVLIALRNRYADSFSWPAKTLGTLTVGETVADLMAARGWRGVDSWRSRACGIAPTIVGGSKKHGGPDLGPTRAKRQWATLGVDGLGIADEAPGPDFPMKGKPRLTLRMVARIQGFADDWTFTGGKTASYRQVGNAFPPPVAKAVGLSISNALAGRVPINTDRQAPLFAAGL